MASTMTTIPIERDAPIPTWFGVGGGADALARPRTEAELLACLDMDPACRILGEGANLLVHDAGVSELIVSLEGPVFTAVEQLPGCEGEPDSETVIMCTGAGASLQKLVIDSVRQGLAGLEGLGGIPATLGGALVMNAGGSFGQIADIVHSVEALDRTRRKVTLARADIDFGYRRSGLNDLILTTCKLELRRADPAVLRSRLKEVMATKATTQPMGEKSAGCCYKNPTLTRTIEGLGDKDDRIGAGLVIDRAGCKGLSVGGARVSDRHANFFPVAKDASAADVIALMEEVERRVFDRFGIPLEREVILWQRGCP